MSGMSGAEGSKDEGRNGEGAKTAEGRFHPVIAGWFRRRFGEPTDVQTQAWAAIGSGGHTLIAAPTGSGKTLAALLPCLDLAIRSKADGPEGTVPSTGVRVLYVTPLKALNNDIHHHVIGFADELQSYAGESGLPWPGLTVGVRTGDTSQSTRASMLRRPPDVLVTTPESLYLLLTSRKAREMLRSVRSVIVDEIHDLAADDRGVHLSLTLERLVEWCGRSPQRIGVSATQKPLERVARFLGGWEEAAEGTASLPADESAMKAMPAVTGSSPGAGSRAIATEAGAGAAGAAGPGQATVPEAPAVTVMPAAGLTAAQAADGFRPRPVRIVESAMEKRFDVAVTMPDYALPSRDKESFWTPLVEKLLLLMEGARSVIVFVVSRRLSERLTLRLNDHVGYELARAHHGSVSREKRLEVERLLKTGELRCIVATSSLELGIDVGHVDLVLQIDSPKTAAAGIQRIGRAGHSADRTSRGIIVARSRGELPEAAVLARAIEERDIEEIRVPCHRLGVLSQQIVAMTATDEWELERLRRVLGRSDCYRGFPRERLEAALQVLAGFYPFAKPLLDWDRASGTLTRVGATPFAALMGAGTIPHSSAYPVHHVESRQHLGELDEEFVHESRVGDVFQLGTSSWMIAAIRSDRVYVRESANGLSEIPFWKAEAPGRSRELSAKVGELLAVLDRGLPSVQEGTAGEGPAAHLPAVGEPVPHAAGVRAAEELLMRDYRLDAVSASQLVSLIRAQKAASAVPTATRIVVEYYKDDAEQHHLVLHALFGKRFNRTWLLALRVELEKTLPVRLYANAKDNGIEFVLSDWDPSWQRLIRGVTAERLDGLLLESLPGSPLLGAAFRRIAETSLLLSRGMVRIPMWKKRLRSEELLKNALPYADRFPYLREAMDECLNEQLDAAGVKSMLRALERGELEWVERKSWFPSPFAVQYLADYVNTTLYESDALGRDLQARLLGMSRELAAEWFSGEAVEGGSALPGLHPEASALEQERLTAEAAEAASEPERLYRLLKRQGDTAPEELARSAADPAQLDEALAGLERSGRIRRIRIAGQTRLICADEADVYAGFPNAQDAADFVLGRYFERESAVTPQQVAARYGLSEAEARAQIAERVASGQLVRSPFAASADEELWSHEKTAARIRRLSAQLYRRETEPVPVERLCRHLAALHRLADQEKPAGPDGLKDAIRRLQGLFLPVSVWESVIFPSRVARYRKEELDLLLASGEAVWIGRKEEPDKEGKIAFFLAESKELYGPLLDGPAESSQPELLALLKHKGASFVSSLARELGMTPSEVNERLLDLVWEGRIANDQFAPLRLHGKAKAKDAAAGSAFRSGLGRWYVLDGLLEQPCDAERSAVSWAHQLLEQHAVLTKEHVRGLPYSWDTMVGVFKRLEEFGLVTRGVLVQGAAGLQFATRTSLEQFRLPPPTIEGPVVLSAVDPANPFGLTVDWPETAEAAAGGSAFARKVGNYVVLLPQAEGPLWIEHNGKRWRPLTAGANPPSGDALRSIVRMLVSLGGMRKLTVEAWNGKPVGATALGDALLAIGAEKDGARLVLWPSSLASAKAT